MATQEGSTNSFPSETAPIEGEDHIPTPNEGSVDVQYTQWRITEGVWLHNNS